MLLRGQKMNIPVSDQVKSVTIPDIQPDLGERQMAMIAGDFTEVYADRREEFDCVCSCFFIDTAHNIIEYLRIIHSLLKKNGKWINQGPLLYHFSGSDSLSLELSWEEVKHIIISLGFKIEKEEIVHTRYCQQQRSLLDHTYHALSFVATKL